MPADRNRYVVLTTRRASQKYGTGSSGDREPQEQMQAITTLTTCHHVTLEFLGF